MGGFWKWPLKTSRPVLNRSHGLCRGLLFACCPGWTYGFTNGSNYVDYDDFTMSRGIWNTAPSNASPWKDVGFQVGGRGIDNGDGSFTAAPEWLVPASDTRYDVTFGWSASVLVRPDVLVTDATIPIFKRRDQPYGAAQPGWHFSGAAANVWRIAFSDGTTERSRSSTTTQDANLVRADLLLATMTPTTLKLYVNGVLEGSTTFAATPMGNPAAPIKFIGLGTAAAGQPNYPGLVGQGAVWDRVLSDGEISLLAADPFRLWRPDAGDELAALDYQTFLAAF